MSRGTPERNLQVEGSNAPEPTDRAATKALAGACADLPGAAQHLFASRSHHEGLPEADRSGHDVDRLCERVFDAVEGAAVFKREHHKVGVDVEGDDRVVPHADRVGDPLPRAAHKRPQA